METDHFRATRRKATAPDDRASCRHGTASDGAAESGSETERHDSILCYGMWIAGLHLEKWSEV